MRYNDIMKCRRLTEFYNEDSEEKETKTRVDEGTEPVA